MTMFSKFAIATVTLVGMTSGTVAQPKAPPAKDAKPPPAKAPPAKDAKAPPAKAEIKVPPNAAPAMPTPPAEVAEMGKIASGTWKCKGDSFEKDGTKVAVTATNKAKVDLDKWWISESLEVKGMKVSFKLNTYTTFDAGSKKWRRIAVDNWGGQMVGTADATEMGKPMTFNMDTMGPMGNGQFRDHIDPSDLKAGLKVWGEMSMDKGKTWNKVYEMTCKK